MAIIKSFNGYTPKIGANCFIAENATIIGDVTIGDNCSIWYGSVLRGDAGAIIIGNNTNVQDGVVLHSSEGVSTTNIGNNVTIGHNAIVHGATIKDNVLVGMGSTVLDNAVVESNTIVAANALVLSGRTLESGAIYAGIPATKVKELKNGEMIAKSAQNYILLKDQYLESKE
ncbi:MAG: gamma carbonic anhydrase family protein [Salinivirgaceae bacterium]|nr:gamma carbonic anhydrase family protein [Salinivirgaceae bacterium]